MHFATRVNTCCVARLYSVLFTETAVSQKPSRIRHIYIYTLEFKITDTMTPRILPRAGGTREEINKFYFR
jgi:hypothetical protein